MKFVNMIRRRRDERGAAMVTTILVGAVLAGLGVAIVDVAVANLQNSGRDRVAGIALDTSESGVAQAIEYIRSNGVLALWCSPNCPEADSYGNSASPKTVTLPNGREFKVWIEVLQHFDPPEFKFGSYKIHSHGTAGTGPGSRQVEVTITAKPFEFPVGIYADTFEDAGDASVHTEHMFSKGCVINRNSIQMGSSTDPQTGATSDVDPFYGYPPAVHAAEYITTENQMSRCGQATSIHAARRCNNTGVPADPLEFAGDQDKAGGGIAGTVCEPRTLRHNGSVSSYFDGNMLTEVFGYQARGLSNSQYAALKAKAQAQGNYWTNATLGSYTPPCVQSCPAGKAPTPNGVLYFKVTASTTIDTQIRAISEFTRAYCGTRSLVVVVEGGSMHINAGVSLTGAIFVPDGNLRFNGQATIEGTMFAKYVNKFNGTAQFHLDECFIKNFPGGLFDVRPEHFREVDR